MVMRLARVALVSMCLGFAFLAGKAWAVQLRVEATSMAWLSFLCAIVLWMSYIQRHVRVVYRERK